MVFKNFGAVRRVNFLSARKNPPFLDPGSAPEAGWSERNSSTDFCCDYEEDEAAQ